MSDNKEIHEFVNGALKQIKDAIPEGYKLNNQINFDISVTTLTRADGKFDIKLAGFGMTSNKQQVHRINFSVIDEKSQKESIQEGINAFELFIKQIATVDAQMKAQKAKSAKKIAVKTNGKKGN